MRESVFETLIGLAVIVVAGIFLWFATAMGGDGKSSNSTVELGVRFNSAAGINRGTDVRMAGVKIGTVRDIRLDKENQKALTTIAIDTAMLPLSVESVARVKAEGLLGGNYVDISDQGTGTSIALCEDGGELFDGSGCGQILNSQGSVDAIAQVADFFGASGPMSDSVEFVELGVRFNSAAGISEGTDVRMAGVKIGTVRDIRLDVDRAEAQVVMAVDNMIMPLEDGSTARVQSEGLLGGSYINIEPAPGFAEIAACGADEKLFGDTGCGEILYGQGSVDLMTLFASFATGSGGSDSSNGSGDSE